LPIFKKIKTEESARLHKKVKENKKVQVKKKKKCPSTLFRKIGTIKNAVERKYKR